MKIHNTKIGLALLAIGFCTWTIQAPAQTSTTVTTTRGAFTEYVPNSQTVVVRGEQANVAPLRYSVTKQTTIVDETGAPIAIERITPGSQLAVQYTGSGDRLVASRIVVQKAATVTAPAVSQQQTTTTTTVVRPLTDDEEDAIEDEKERRKEAAEKEIERRKEALDEAKDRLEDDDD